MTAVETRLTDETLAADLEALIGLDPHFAAARARTGPPTVRRLPGGFPGLLRILSAQLVSTASAAAIYRRLEEAGLTDPTAAAAAGVDPLFACGLTRAKARSAHGLAAAVTSGALDVDAVAALEVEAATAALTAYRGVGPWSAEVYLLMCEGRRDVFPAGDLALRAATALLLGQAERPSIGAVAEIARGWAPYRSAAALQLWAYYTAMHGRAGAP